MELVESSGWRVLDKNGREVEGDELDEHVVLLYFSFEDAPECARFGRIFKGFYEILQGLGTMSGKDCVADVQAIFVPLGTTAAQAEAHFQEHHGDWLMLDCSQSEEALQRYQVSSAPAVVVVDCDGIPVDDTARGKISIIMVLARCGLGRLAARRLLGQWKELCGVQNHLPDDGLVPGRPRHMQRCASKVTQIAATSPLSIIILLMKFVTLAMQLSAVDSAYGWEGGSPECIFVHAGLKLYLLVYVLGFPLFLMKACRVGSETMQPLTLAEGAVNLLMLLYSVWALVKTHDSVCEPHIYDALLWTFAFEAVLLFVVGPLLQSVAERGALLQAVADAGNFSTESPDGYLPVSMLSC